MLQQRRHSLYLVPKVRHYIYLNIFSSRLCSDVFQRALKSEKVIPKLAEKLSDPFGSFRSRSAARSTMLDLSEKGWEIKPL